MILRESVGDEESTYQLAKCCSPIPGDEVVAVRQENEILLVHRTDCSNGSQNYVEPGE